MRGVKYIKMIKIKVFWGLAKRMINHRSYYNTLLLLNYSGKDLSYLFTINAEIHTFHKLVEVLINPSYSKDRNSKSILG